MTEHKKANWQVGGKFFKYYCPFCKAEYMNNKLSFCVVCEAKLEKGKKPMTVIDKKPVPLYIKECSECGSTFTYRKVEVSFTGYIYCPVCGVSLWANFERAKDKRKEAE